MIKKGKGHTIKEIATLAGCSPATVSNVLNGKGFFGEETKQKVLEACQKSNYTPNAAARNLRVGKTETIGLIFSRVSANIFGSAFYLKLISALQESLAKENYDLLLSEVSAHSNGGVPILPRVVHQAKVDAVILLGGAPQSLVQMLLGADVPLLLLDSFSEGADSITSNGRAASADMVRRLAQSGHRRIAYFAYDYADFNTDMRIAGFLDAAKECALESFEVVRDFPQKEGARRGLDRIFANYSKAPTAILAVNDELAFSIIAYAVSRGIDVPKDLSVFGFDDTQVAMMSVPQISTAHVDMTEMGRKAADMMLERIKNPAAAPVQTLLQAPVIMRASCAEAFPKKI